MIGKGESMDIFTYLGKNRISKKDLARNLGMSDNTIYNILIGKHFPRMQTLLKMREMSNGELKIEGLLIDFWKLYKEYWELE